MWLEQLYRVLILAGPIGCVRLVRSTWTPVRPSKICWSGGTVTVTVTTSLGVNTTNDYFTHTYVQDPGLQPSSCTEDMHTIILPFAGLQYALMPGSSSQSATH